jgi:hypothetical protein
MQGTQTADAGTQQHPPATHYPSSPRCFIRAKRHSRLLAGASVGLALSACVPHTEGGGLGGAMMGHVLGLSLSCCVPPRGAAWLLHCLLLCPLLFVSGVH